jgi:hypothetical protein
VKALSRLIVKIADLAEAEARAFRAGAVWVGVSIALSLAAGLIGVVGVGFLVFALFAALSPSIGQAWAGALVGLVLLGAAGGLLWLVVKKFAR